MPVIAARHRRSKIVQPGTYHGAGKRRHALGEFAGRRAGGAATAVLACGGLRRRHHGAGRVGDHPLAARPPHRRFAGYRPRLYEVQCRAGVCAGRAFPGAERAPGCGRAGAGSGCHGGGAWPALHHRDADAYRPWDRFFAGARQAAIAAAGAISVRSPPRCWAWPRPRSPACFICTMRRISTVLAASLRFRHPPQLGCSCCSLG